MTKLTFYLRLLFVFVYMVLHANAYSKPFLTNKEYRKLNRFDNYLAKNDITDLFAVYDARGVLFAICRGLEIRDVQKLDNNQIARKISSSMLTWASGGFSKEKHRPQRTSLALAIMLAWLVPVNHNNSTDRGLWSLAQFTNSILGLYDLSEKHTNRQFMRKPGKLKLSPCVWPGTTPIEDLENPYDRL